MLTIQYKKINELIPYARNSRTHSDAQVAQIAASIKEFGWTNPVLMDGDNGIIAGHGRVLAARMLGHTDIPTIELSHLSDIQKKAYIIADNKLALNAGWDDEVLGLEIAELKEFGFDTELLGFSEAEINKLFDEKIETSESTVPIDELNVAWSQWAGEVYEQINVLMTTGSPIMGVTKGYALEKFLKAKYDKQEYPRHCSLAFHSHQIMCAGDSKSVLDGLLLVSDNKIKPERLRFYLGKMDAKKIASGGLAFSGSRMPLDFPANLATSLINEFAPNGKVLDPCHGWGGRLVGFLLSSANEYVGIDVSPETSNGVKLIYETFYKYTDSKNVELNCIAFEEYQCEENKFDFAITSPPYFDVEKYIGGDQSHKKYNNYDLWKNGFYKTLIHKVYKLLRTNGVFCLQVGSQSYPLVEDGKSIAKDIGFNVLEVRQTIMVNNQAETDEDRSEVIVVLQK
jgi:hypothetical protein